MPRYVDYAAVCLAALVIMAAMFSPAPWAHVCLAVWTLGSAIFLLARARARGGAIAEMEILGGSASPAGGSGSSIVVAHLEVQCSRARLSQFDGPGPDLAAVSGEVPSGLFDADVLRSVLESNFVGHRSLVRWNLCSFPMRQYPGHSAEQAYTELLGPLQINGRMWHILELHIDTAELAAANGSASQAAATVRKRVQGLLAHRGISTRPVRDPDQPGLARMWLAAPAEQRALLSARRESRPGEGFSLVIGCDALAQAQPVDSITSYAPPAQGAGPIVGANENDSAVCIDLCGAHLRSVVLAGRFESLEFLVLRTAALGRRAIAVADNPDRWHGLAVAAGVDVIYSQFTIDSALTSGNPYPLSEALSRHCDIVYWDTELAVPSHLTGRDGGLTICRVLSGDSEDIERKFGQREIRDADLIVDGRVSGWFTIQIRGDISDSRPRRVTVQAVETAAEIACLADGRSAPKPFATLTV
ncbi:MAG TPA: hypothetical protein K8V11_05420 [Dietzia timorensis]|uniref:Type VII secretion protein EccE n=1 Tax=Dietzia timorensis TaxID=499555 RepID=A0A921F4G6_9ACTN|nr:hypothetical protein [Dietzia timorensis]HJE90429.1 hypothetical protein [Dietzia timorensis]